MSESEIYRRERKVRKRRPVVDFSGCSKRLRGEAREKSASGGVHRRYVDARRLSATKHMSLFQQSSGAGPGATAAAFILLAAAAGAGIVSSGLARGGFCVGRAHNPHQLLDRFARFDQLGEFLEIRLAVAEERFKPGA